MPLNSRNTSIELIARNAVGTVTFTSDATWVTVDSDGVVTINPTSVLLVGTTQIVTITATDPDHVTGRATDTIELTITVTGSISGSSGGGGCDAGFGALALVLATPLFLRKRRS